MKMTQAQYRNYIDQMSPPSRLWSNLLRAFLVGGAICALGEGIVRLYVRLGAELPNAQTGAAITLIFLGALLTGLQGYDDLAKIGKAGALVPITGFSNAVVSPAMEFKAEGHVAGLSAKLFSIAGPVLVFGALAASLYGLVYSVFR
ncbi:MAG: SpoVA/SpoVAEb family sporulation membrane protein [Oscillospiraceae bacterium]|nr:SpoVA/SpoVAEb family sporulation membrane protein [Oscillospiraceae bacterium]